MMPYITLGLCRSLVFSSIGQKVQKKQAGMKKNHSPLKLLERKLDWFPHDVWPFYILGALKDALHYLWTL